MAKRNNTHKGQTASCPEGWHPDGHTLPINLTVKQQHYGRRATVISRFVYNLCVATRRFCRKNRLKWPSWQDLTRAINAAKKDDFPFVAEVHYQVAEGAVKQFGKAVANWRDPDHRATAPVLHKKRLIGSGSFLAASGIKNIRHDGKRRITPPCMGSVKLNHTLPKGIVHEARIAFRNRQWVLSVNYWKPPQPAPESDTCILAGAVDTGINPHATDSEGQTWKTRRRITRPSASCAARNGPRNGTPPGPAAGGRHNDASTGSTAA